ncbi:MAG TPA: serine/threonine-protein kinase, partial [Kofleriaceae bacterium]|nr:serine/threonine-protein kinase [Kofleriaceae bacterium]
MTTRDPRFRAQSPATAGHGRDPTQSLSLDAAIDEPYDAAHDAANPSSLAHGTHDPGGTQATGFGAPGSGAPGFGAPGARMKTPVPPRHGPPPIPRAATTDEPYQLGSVLGSYRLLETLGKGGMGYVYRAEHMKLGREVALKLLRSDYAQRRDAVARFFQEARTVNRVRHRNIVDVTDFVELDDGTTFIIMELLAGESLGQWVRGGVDLPRALAVLVQICDGLAAAHEVGVIHRDLKPDNVFVVPTADGAELVKLLDFGVAKLVNRDDEDLGFQTAAGAVIGTPAYMSPEQAGGMAVDPRSDIYSLGAIMYELFCGEPMFRGRSFGEFVRKHLTEMPVPPRQTAGGMSIDPRLEALIMRSLAKDPIERFPNIVELRDTLLAMLGAMDTHLSGIGTGNGVRVSTNLGPLGLLAPIAPLPQLPAGAYPKLPTALAHPPGATPSQQQQYWNQSSQIPPTAVRSPTPWKIWILGGAIAVALGTGTAVWYAGRGTLPTAPAPEAAGAKVEQPAPIAEPAPAAPPVEVRLDSSPAGTVFADGSTTPLCQTPCTRTIDPKDGGSPDRRTFVVRSDGHLDGTIVVDLRGEQRDFRVALEPREVHAAETEETAAKTDETAAETEETAAKTDETAGKTGKKPTPTVRPQIRPRVITGKRPTGKTDARPDKTDAKTDKTDAK